MDHFPYSYCMLLLLYAITCTIPGTQVNKTTPKVLDEILRNLLPPQERQGFANQAIRTTVGGDHDQEGRAAETRQDLGQVNWEMMNSLSSSISACRIYDIYIYTHIVNIYIYIYTINKYYIDTCTHMPCIPTVGHNY